jgi:triphosphoribosyl-dephospho-CoA synthetase
MIKNVVLVVLAFFFLVSCKNEKTKNALLICLRNVLKNLDLNNVEENETKEGIDYLTEKYKDLLKNDEKKGDEKLARLHKLLGMII